MARRGGYSRDTIARYQRNDYRHFSSVSDFLAAVVPVGKKQYHDDKWAGGSFDDAVRFCRNGDIQSTGDAVRLADMINDAVELAGARSEWVPDMVGAFPSVPAFLAGDPCSMWARSPVQDDRGEIDVYIDLAASVKDNVLNMRRRGVCVLALLMALQRVRNVRAHLYTAHVGGNFTLDFSYPFDVSELAAFCARPVVIRDLTYCWCNEISKEYKSGGIPWNLFARVYASEWCERVCHDRKTEIEALRKYAGVAPGSLVITQGAFNTLAGLSDDDFINHINKTIKAVNDGEEDLTI